MQTFILDASQIDPNLEADQFIAEFYNLPFKEPIQIRNFLFSDETLRITKVFNWPSDAKNWMRISLMLEMIQQRSPHFYLIWGPENQNNDIDQQAESKEDIESEISTTIVDKIQL